MISNIFSKKLLPAAARALVQKPARNFRTLFKNEDLPNAEFARFDPAVPLKGHTPTIINDKESNIKLTTLKNGVRVITEVTQFPNLVDMGILFDVGTRDETEQTSGVILSIKNTYLKHTLEANNSENYNLLQQTGGNFAMDYDQESIYYKLNALSYNVKKTFDMMMDTAFSKFTPERAHEGIVLNHSVLEGQAGSPEDFNNVVLSTAYGPKGLGMPLRGHPRNLMNLTEDNINNFMWENFTPDRIYIAGAGIEDHQEFVDMVEKKVNQIDLNTTKKLAREKAKYKGGELRIPRDEEMVTVMLGFESVDWKHQDMTVLNVLNTLVGSSASFSTGGPGKGMWSRATKHMMNKFQFVDAASSINLHFCDTGIYGISVSGPAADAREILQMIIGELKDLTNPMPAEEVSRAKNILKAHILMAMERQQDRIEETVKNIKTFDRFKVLNYTESVDQITGDDINRVVAKMLSSRPILVAQGGQTLSLPNFDKIQNLLRI